MIIELTQDLPINAKHKCTEGARFKVHKVKLGRGKLAYFNDHNGEECAAYNYEYNVVEGSMNDHDVELVDKDKTVGF